jgi:hypothetical protein
VMRQSPDDPRGYDEFARLTTRLRAGIRSPLTLAARFADLGLLTEARGIYADVSGALGPERVHVELWRLRARLAVADGDPAEAARLTAEADTAVAPGRPVGATMGGQVELVGYDIVPEPLRAGEPAELTTHWRLHRAPWGRLMAWVHLRAEDRPEGQGTRFGDDFPLVGFLPELGAPQHLSVRRRIVVPADATVGRYRVVGGLWSPTSGWRLHRWWRGLLPTLTTTLALGRVEVVRPAP